MWDARIARVEQRMGQGAWAAAICAIAALVSGSCSSESRPAQLQGCTSAANGLPCVGPITGGGQGGSPGGQEQPMGDASTTVVLGDGATCPGAMQIFAATGTSCATCAAANCCETPASCPNDPACLSIATCVVTQCVANDQSCLPTCEAAAPTGTVTAFIDFQQCVGQACPGCPLLAAATLLAP